MYTVTADYQIFLTDPDGPPQGLTYPTLGAAKKDVLMALRNERDAINGQIQDIVHLRIINIPHKESR